MNDSALVPPGAWRIWAVGVLVYLTAVFHRSSLAVAGLEAADRFGISAAALATFVTLQLCVYAGLQIPVGLLVDRFGPRTVLITGTAVISLAQVGFAVAESFPLALIARAFLGIGDAMTFICVLRVIGEWFPARRIPLITQLTGVTGQLGAVVAAAPMGWALRELGWTSSFLVAAGVGGVLFVLLLIVVRDAPGERNRRGEPLSWTRIRSRLATSWRQPGTRLGFWMHFTTQFSATSLGLLWGYPFLVRAEGLTDGQANALLTTMVLAIMAAGPLLGWGVGRNPWHRSTMVIAIVLAMMAAWTVVLAWPGEAPLPVLVGLVIVVGVGGPASMIGFDLARTSNPADRVGSATAIVNQGGFLASLITVIAIGAILDWRTPGSSTAYSAESFRWAMAFQYVLWSLGLVQLVRYRIRTRAALLAADPDVRSKMIGLG